MPNRRGFDHIGNFNFKVEIEGVTQGAFKNVEGLDSETEVVEFQDGEDIVLRKRPGRTKYSNLTLKRGYINTEFQELVSEIDRISNSTKFNGSVLLDGTFKTTGMDFQVGHENGANFRITVQVADVTTTALGFAAADAVDNKANSQAVMAKIDTALDTLNTARASLGAKANRLTTAASAVDVMRENLSAANSRIRDTNVAEETSAFARSQVLMQAGVSMLAQANSQPQLALSLLG